MKQSLLALLALSMCMTLSLSQQQASLRYHRLVYGRDVEIAAVDLARAYLATIQARAFDEADVLARGLNVTLYGLTGHIGREDADPESIEGYDDIDDFDGFHHRIAHIFNQRSYTFDVTIEVRNVDPHNPAVQLGGAASLAKEVSVQVAEPDSLARDRPRVGVRLSRTLARLEHVIH